MGPPQIPKDCIVLAWFPYTDFSYEKLRPALVLYEGYLDVTVAYISGQVPATLLPTDILIPPGTSAGLKDLSVLSIDKIVMLVKEMVEGKLGEADSDLKREVNAKIAQCLMFHDTDSTNP